MKTLAELPDLNTADRMAMVKPAMVKARALHPDVSASADKRRIYRSWRWF
jgi:hypothetical protein